MTTESPWHSRWRSESHYQGHYFDRMQAPQVAAPATIGNQASPNLPSATDSYSKPWESMSRGETEHYPRGVPSMIDSYADGSTYHSRLHPRHNSPGRLTNSPPRTGPNQSWHSLPVDHHHSQNRHTTDAPLTLHIPQTQDLPKLSTAYQNTPTHRRGSQPVLQQQATALPSFASLSEQANRAEDPDEVEIAPMSARLSCHSCNKLTPLLRDIAITVAELDENVQQYCNKSITRTLDFPKDNPIRAAQWILERLAKTKIDLQDTARRMQGGYSYAQPPTSYLGVSSRTVSPPSGIKRSADRWEHDELPVPKRPRSGASFNEVSSMAAPRDGRRASIDFAPRSPPPTDSIPGSAYPRIGSPGLSARPGRTLPSPSSLAYPPSAAPSLAPATAASGSSPTALSQPPVSIHTASTSSATSQHIADLQHQVTLKSLALQTLQSEYASLLQKLQRERVKSQTIEKKTSVADQEVNDLTSKNEDLTDQLKTLETQLEECEKKRESERLTAASERDQWTKLLALDRQLQSKNAEEKQKLREEKSLLSQRVAAFEDETISRLDPLKRNSASRTSATRVDADGEESNLTPAATTVGSLPADATNVESLRHEIVVLNHRIQALRSSLEEAKRRTQESVDRNADICASIDRTLEEDCPRIAKTPSPNPQIQLQASALPSQAASSVQPNVSRTLSQSPNLREVPSATQTTASSSSTVSMASIARAISPGPAELGFHVAPSTSTPEELIAALGPVPPTYGGVSGKRSSSTAQRKKARKRSPDTFPESSTALTSTQFGSFRPLTFTSAYPHSGHVAEQVDAPFRSYASSPGSVTGRHSPSSSGSESRRSSDEENNSHNIGKVRQSTFTAGLPSPGPSTEGYNLSTAMPPPPRPSMSLKDLCSMPTEPKMRP